MKKTIRSGENPLDPILNSPDKKSKETNSSAGGILARWYRTILHDLKITGTRFSESLSRYLEIIYPNNNLAASNARGSFHKKFSEPEFTWKVFLEGLRVLGVEKVDFNITLHNADGSKSTHSLDVLLMGKEDTLRYLQEWRKDHGIHTADPEYLKVLEEQRQKVKQDIQSNIDYYADSMHKIRKAERKEIHRPHVRDSKKGKNHAPEETSEADQS